MPTITLPLTSTRADLIVAVSAAQAGCRGGLATGALVDEVLAALRRAAVAAKALELKLIQLEPQGTWWAGTEGLRSTTTMIAVTPTQYEITRGEPSERVGRGVLELRLHPAGTP